MPGEVLATYKTIWGEIDYSSKPTEYDPIGCDGIYVYAIRIRWSHWKARRFILRWVFSRYKWWYPKFWWLLPKFILTIWKRSKNRFGVKL